MQDTFYIDGRYLLRSHTTTAQPHVMEHHAPPLRIASPGRCYRNETVTGRSHVLFHQVDLFYVDKGVSLGDLLTTQEAFYQRLFGEKICMRTRPSYFPFVEPGLEVDISCQGCSQQGCSLCKQSGWLEVAGAGMIHPHVLEAGGIDPSKWSGYAWGIGLERLVMLLHKVDNIRLFTENRPSFLNQFIRA
ncbi:MAG: phenylalanine--tRNA ligase subunit alpha, partial [Chlamydiota bacterium]|nr:phenylalanine--tRNA ligase subunit alpha [Chlamydiota bacterium]